MQLSPTAKLVERLFEKHISISLSYRVQYAKCDIEQMHGGVNRTFLPLYPRLPVQYNSIRVADLIVRNIRQSTLPFVSRPDTKRN